IRYKYSIITDESKNQLLTKIYNFPQNLGELSNNILKIIVDELVYEFRIYFNVQYELVYDWILEHLKTNEKILINFNIIPLVENNKGVNSIEIEIKTDSKHFQLLINYIISKLNSIFRKKVNIYY
ncbi:MAG: hypothetical protein QXO96_06235, partial [Sulfolobales archaeon]